ncbi:MAG: sortase [Clostridia bacterium]|nr:sortase [Clostridia bacterium]
MLLVNFQVQTLTKFGNLCIAGHNFNDSRFFGNLSKLTENDEIQIFNSNGHMLKYIVFDKYETESTDTSCTIPSAKNSKEITLVTCNNLNGNRLIIKAKYIT